MGRYQEELLALANEIAASEGIPPLAAALERATVELRGLVVYAHDWNQHAAEAQWSLISVAQTA
jgi:hypothetical protein